MNEGRDLLLAGGSGTVGRKIAAFLARAYPDRVVIAARNLEKASQVASEIGYGVRARPIDVRDPRSVEEAMVGTGTVMSCVAQPETPHLLLASIARGCGYTDIAPMALKRPPYPDTLNAEAVKTRARIILGAGMVPGISNVLARLGVDAVGPVRTVETTCLLSVGDEYGTDSRVYLAEELITPFHTTIDGEKVPAAPFTRPKRVEFAPPVGAIKAYLFPFSDQIYYPDTLGARTAVSRLALLPRWVPEILAFLLPVVGRALARRQAGSPGRLGGLMDGLKRAYRGLDWWGVKVEITGSQGAYAASVQGHGQAEATALSAAAFVQALVEHEVDCPGIWTADQVVPADPFLDRLAAHGIVPVVEVNGTAPASPPLTV